MIATRPSLAAGRQTEPAASEARDHRERSLVALGRVALEHLGLAEILRRCATILGECTGADAVGVGLQEPGRDPAFVVVGDFTLLPHDPWNAAASQTPTGGDPAEPAVERCIETIAFEPSASLALVVAARGPLARQAGDFLRRAAPVVARTLAARIRIERWGALHRAARQFGMAASFWLDRDGHVTDLNAAAERLCGLSLERLPPVPWPFVARHCRDHLAESLEFVVSNGTSLAVRSIVQRGDGSSVPARFEIEPLVDFDEKVLGAFTRIDDIGPLVCREASLACLARTSAWLASGTEIAVTLPLVLGTVAELVGGRRATLWTLDSRARAFLRRAVWPSEPPACESAESARQTDVRMVWTEGLPGRVREERQIAYRSPDASGARPRGGGAIGLPVSTGERLDAVVVIEGDEVTEPDDTSRRCLEAFGCQLALALAGESAAETLRTTETELSQRGKLESLGVLVGSIAHDFNNLLTIILAHAALARDLAEPQSPIRELMEEVHGTSARAAGLTRQLLGFSHRQEYTASVVELNGIVRDVAKLLVRLVGEGISLETDLADDVGHVEADPARVEQALVNLVVNARDAIRDGGRVTIRTRNVGISSADARLDPRARAGRFAVVSVEDTGTGIDRSTLDRLFEPFFSTKSRGAGTGLGLAIVADTARRAAGFVTVSSEPGGTTFSLYLPHRVPGLCERRVRSAVEAVPGGCETIVVVEDEPAVRSVVADVLRVRGYHVLEAEDADAALELVRGQRADLLLADVRLPGTSGVEMGRRVRRRFGIPVLLVTGYTDVEPPAGDDGPPLIRKPFTSEELARSVRACLDSGCASSSKEVYR